MRLKRTALGISGTAAAVLLVATGCGSSNGGRAGAAADGSSATASGNPLKLMFIGSLSGQSQFSEFPAGARAAALAINAAGGIKGRPVEILDCDTKLSPEGVVACAQRLVSSGAVAAIASLDGESTALVDTSVKNGIANIGLTGVGSTDLAAASTTSFPLQVPGTGLLACPAALGAAGVTKVGALALNVGAGLALVEGVKATTKSVPGVHFTGSAVVDLGVSDLAGPIQTVINQGAKGVVLAMSEPQAVAALRVNNGRLKICSVEQISRTDLEGLGHAARGFVEVSSSPPLDLAATSGADGKQFIADLDGYYAKTADKAASPEVRKGNSLLAWMSVRAFQRVADKQSEVTRASVLKGFSETKDLAFPGLLPAPIDFTATTPVPQLARLFVSKFNFYTWDPATKAFTAGEKSADLIGLLTGKPQ